LSADAEKLFKKLIRDLRPLFKENGFRASSQNFILESPECWVIINFQKSRWSDAGEKTFYVNVGAMPKRWLEFCNETMDKVPPYYSLEKAPPYYAGDWRWRAERFGPDKNVQQWTVRDEDSAREVFTYLHRLFRDFVIPAAKTMTTEADLLGREADSHLGYPQLKVRSVWLAATGQVAALKGTVSTLIERFGSGTVAEGTRNHIEALRAKFPEQMRLIELGHQSS
jgi:Domain of unknown function (DUF4304)